MTSDGERMKRKLQEMNISDYSAEQTFYKEVAYLKIMAKTTQPPPPPPIKMGRYLRPPPLLLGCYMWAREGGGTLTDK